MSAVETLWGPTWKGRPVVWVLFSKDIKDPKLAWLERRMDARSIAHRRNGEARNAPLLEVELARIHEVWDEILTPEIDNMADDDPFFWDGVELRYR